MLSSAGFVSSWRACNTLICKIYQNYSVPAKCADVSVEKVLLTTVTHYSHFLFSELL